MAAKKNKCEELSHYQNFERHKRLLNLKHNIWDWVVGSVSDPLHFNVDPDPRIRFRDNGSGFGSGSGSGSDL